MKQQWPGTYWLEKVKGIQFMEEPDLSNKSKLEEKIEEAKSLVQTEKNKSNSEEKIEKAKSLVRKAKYELFKGITEPCALYRAWKWEGPDTFLFK